MEGYKKPLSREQRLLSLSRFSFLEPSQVQGDKRTLTVRHVLLEPFCIDYVSHSSLNGPDLLQNNGEEIVCYCGVLVKRTRRDRQRETHTETREREESTKGREKGSEERERGEEESDCL